MPTASSLDARIVLDVCVRVSVRVLGLQISLVNTRDTHTRSLMLCTAAAAARRAAKYAKKKIAALCWTSATTPSCRTFSRARGVFIFVRNFSRGIFLGKSLSKVAAAAADPRGGT
jgi:hypothetical protein